MAETKPIRRVVGDFIYEVDRAALKNPTGGVYVVGRCVFRDKKGRPLFRPVPRKRVEGPRRMSVLREIVNRKKGLKPHEERAWKWAQESEPVEPEPEWMWVRLLRGLLRARRIFPEKTWRERYRMARGWALHPVGR